MESSNDLGHREEEAEGSNDSYNSDNSYTHTLTTHVCGKKSLLLAVITYQLKNLFLIEFMIYIDYIVLVVKFNFDFTF